MDYLDDHKRPRDIRGATRTLKQAAKDLRRSMTPAEGILWERLNLRRLNGLRIRRQHPIGRFILDFYCPEHKLVIEVDGPIHEQQAEHDEERTEQLRSAGLTVLRFKNVEVMEQTEQVLEKILACVISLDT
jgi:very-short-patch-repair endonuclease